jgi:hypothetical protein
MRVVPFIVTTDSGGGFTSAAAGSNKLVHAHLLYAINWVDTSYDAGVDAVLSVTDPVTGESTTLFTFTNADAEAWYYPRVLQDDTSGADLTGVYAMQVVIGTLKLVVTNGGNAKAGKCMVYLVEL